MKANCRTNFADYLDLQRVAPKTKESYLHAVSDIAGFHHQTPENLSTDQIQDYLLHCIQVKQLEWASCNVLFCALKKSWSRVWIFSYSNVGSATPR